MRVQRSKGVNYVQLSNTPVSMPREESVCKLYGIFYGKNALIYLTSMQSYSRNAGTDASVRRLCFRDEIQRAAIRCRDGAR